jgi:hypothetical protein
MKATRQQLLAEIESLKCELERYREIAALYRISLGDCAANRILSKLPRTSLRDQCQAAGVPFLFKQWGSWAPSGDRRLPDPLGLEIWQEGGWPKARWPRVE